MEKWIFSKLRLADSSVKLTRVNSGQAEPSAGAPPLYSLSDFYGPKFRESPSAERDHFLPTRFWASLYRFHNAPRCCLARLTCL